MRLILACLVITVFFLTPSTSFAESINDDVTGGQINEAVANIASARFLPPNPLYYGIRFKELVSRFFTSSSVKRGEFDFLIASKRLKEGYLVHGRGDEDGVEMLLNSYGNSLSKSVDQLKKARSQNQEIVPAVDKIVEGLKYHEVFLLALARESEGTDYSMAVEAGISDFRQYVEELDKIKPGAKSRFRLSSTNGTTSEGRQKHFPTPSPSLLSEPSSSARPNRFIY